MTVSGSAGAKEFSTIAGHPTIVGVSKVYKWSDLEPLTGSYNFDRIAQDIAYVRSLGKRFFIRIDHTRFNRKGSPIIPADMTRDSSYGCPGNPYGVFEREAQAGGWIPCFWNSNVKRQLIQLYQELGRRFNDEPYLEGIRIGETAIDFNTAKKDKDYSASKVRDTFFEVALAAKRAFPGKQVLQMINFAQYDLNSFTSDLAKNGIGISGPDLYPGAERGGLGKTYDLMEQYHWQVATGPSVQWSNYQKNGATAKSLLALAISETNPWYMFWLNRQPYWESDVLPTLRSSQLPAAAGFYR
jgi:hypothetical protein